MAEDWREKSAHDRANTPIMVIPDHTPFQLRKAALDAAVAMQGDKPNRVFWQNLATFEDYLRDGTKAG